MHPQSSTQRLPQETEEWRPVVGFESWYEVSSLGRVRRTRTGSGTRVGLILRPALDKDGYAFVYLCRESTRKFHRVSRMVAAAFLGPAPIGHQVNHKNGVKIDNQVGNLEWVTRSENRLHAFATGLQTGTRGDQNGRSKLKEADVRVIRAARGHEMQDSLASRFGVDQSTISDIQRGKSWRHVEHLRYSHTWRCERR